MPNLRTVASADDPVDEDGLTAVEREYLSAPFSQLNDDQRRTAMAIKDKQMSNRFSTKAEQNRQAQEKIKNRFK